MNNSRFPRAPLPYLLGCVAVLCLAGGPTSPYEEGYYRSPVRHPLQLSGTFGELRQDHFHAGIDVKRSRGKYADDLLAVADGYVSRLLVSSRGFGNAVYVDHPNGTRSVYAHLSAFAPAIRAYLDSVHYARESFELDLDAGDGLSPKRFPVSSGTVLGKMGNTGGSFGAHLHFELRLQANDAAFNPLLYDFPVRDTRAPAISEVSVYRRGPGGNVERLMSTLTEDTLHVPPGGIAFGIKTIDQQDGGTNRNGVYRLEAYADSLLIWQTTYDTVAFEDTRYIQAHYDYRAARAGDGYFYRLHRLPGDELPLYEVHPNDGFVVVPAGGVTRIELVSADPFGNKTVERLVLKADAPVPPPRRTDYTHVLPQGEPSVVTLDSAELELAADALYATTYLPTSVLSDRSVGVFSPVYRIGDPSEPIHGRVTLTIPVNSVPVGLRSKAFIGRCTLPGKYAKVASALTPDSSALTGRLGSWGEFTVCLDTLPPTIDVENRYTFRIEDGVSATERLRYRVTQDGAWVLASLDAKNNRLSVRKDRLRPGAIRLEVWDEAGNKSEI